MRDPFPVSEIVLCYFVSFLGGQGLSPSTIKTYLAAVRHMQVCLGFPEPREVSSLPLLKLVQAGVARARTLGGVKSRVRLPITVSILDKLCECWPVSLHMEDKKMLTAAALTCFYGFFRSGEVTVATKKSFNPALHLAVEDLSLDSNLTPTVVKIHLKSSKCDQFGRGVDVYIGQSHTAWCPVKSMVTYLMDRGPSKGHLFQWKDGSPLTRPEFSKYVKAALVAAGVANHESYTGHSFRIGAATAAAQAYLIRRLKH